MFGQPTATKYLTTKEEESDRSADRIVRQLVLLLLTGYLCESQSYNLSLFQPVIVQVYQLCLSVPECA